MSEESRRRRVSFEQQQSMIEFMVQHVDLARSRARSTEFRHECKKLWSELTKIMNSHRQGTKRTAIEWSKYWSDYKNKLKKKLLLIKIAKHKNKPPSVTLTKMDKTVMSILGKNYFPKQRSMHKTKLERSDSIGDKKIKTELFDESSDCDNASESSERFEGESDFNETLPVLNVDFDRPISADLNMDNLCPQWLIETEQKRAEAEMIRARAEQHQATIAARTAETALIQAEALKKLAEAATAQAEALTRIASLLEPVAALLKDGRAVNDFREQM